MKVLIIGGGPAGMIAAITSAINGNSVTIIEKKCSLGRKLLITGKGRCNITSSLPIDEFIRNIPGNGRFLYSCFEKFTNDDIVKFLKIRGVNVKEERGNRIFPKSDRSQDVLNAFEEEIKKLRIDVKLNTQVTKIEIKDKKLIGVYCKNNEHEIFMHADRVVLATGGMSYPDTGSTGDGYKMAKELGHTIIDIKPSLVPLISNGKSLQICKSLQGLSLKNVEIKIEEQDNKKVIYNDFGEMIFTHYGVSGPIILSSSAHILRYKNIENLFKNDKVKLKIDLKPALTTDKLDIRILRDFEKEKNKLFKNSLEKLLPQKLIETIVEISGIDPNKKINEITKAERNNLIKALKEFTINICGFRPINEAIITSGGINIKEINPKTMESKIISGLYFAGEIIDVDAYTGGFNLQIAYSTGYTAGNN